MPGVAPFAHRFVAFGVLMLIAASGVLAIVSFPAAHAAGASTVGTTTNQYGLGYSSDYYTCGASGRFWVFYNDGTSWGWQSSTDGQTWSSRATFSTSVPPPASGTNDLGIYCSGSTVYYAGGAQSADAHFYYDTGALNPDGTIAWGTEASVPTLGDDVGYTSVTLDSNGHVWVALQSQNTGGGGPYYDEVYELTSGWAPSLTLTFASYLPIPQMVPLTLGKMALLYGTGHVAIATETWSGSVWSAGPSTSATNYFPQFSTAVAIGDTVEYCASDQTSAYYLTLPYGGSWSSASTIAAASACSATTDGTSVLGLFYVSNPTTITYAQSNNAGSSFLPAVTVSSSEASVGWVGAALAVSSNPAKQAMAVWLSGSASPFTVRFSNLSTAPVVNEQVTISDANSAPAAFATVSGCSATVTSIPIDGAAHTFGADPSCTLTITAPTDRSYTRFRFPGGSASWTFLTGSTSPDAHSNSVYYQYSVTASYSLSSGCGSPPPPTLTSTQGGAAYSSALSTSATVYWLDGGALWSVSPTVTSGSTTCQTGSPTSGTVTGPTIMTFNYSPTATATTTTATVTGSTTTVTVARTTVTSTSTVTSTPTTTSTVLFSTTTTSTVFVTTTTIMSTTASGGPVPTSSSLTCDQPQVQVGQNLNCDDVVSTADQGTASGTVTWTTSGSGSFSHTSCDNPNNGQLHCSAKYSSGSSGAQTLAASYGGDPYHSASTGTLTVFVGSVTPSGQTSVSVTCDQTYPQVGQQTKCHATVTAADGKALTGTVAWTTDSSGSFSHVQCGSNGNEKNGGGKLTCQASYTGSTTGQHIVTATYSGDGGHSGSSGSFGLFVQNGNDGEPQQAAILVPGGALLITGLSVVALEAKKGRERKAEAS